MRGPPFYFSVSDGVYRSGPRKGEWEVGVRRRSGDVGEDSVPKVEREISQKRAWLEYSRCCGS